jgi:integrase
MKRIKTHRKQIIRQIRIVTREEEIQIVALLRQTEINQRKPYFSDVADLVEVLADTGLRKLEALELMYGDIDFERKMIFIRQTKSRPRRIPMTSRVATILARRLEANQDKPFNLNEMQIRIAWTWAKTEIGINDPNSLVLYSLRRACAQRLINSGVYIEIISEWLGLPSRGIDHRKIPLTPYELTKAAEMLENYNQTYHQ